MIKLLICQILGSLRRTGCVCSCTQRGCRAWWLGTWSSCKWRSLPGRIFSSFLKFWAFWWLTLSSIPIGCERFPTIERRSCDCILSHPKARKYLSFRPFGIFRVCIDTLCRQCPVKWWICTRCRWIFRSQSFSRSDWCKGSWSLNTHPYKFRRGEFGLKRNIWTRIPWYWCLFLFGFWVRRFRPWSFKV